MSNNFNPADFEKKWRDKWQQEEIYKTPILHQSQDGNSKEDKAYILDMYPYPSGSGLHVGHPRGYLATDVVARFNRMIGKKVLHPMGFDSFGLPAENYAIKTGTPPAESTNKAIAYFKEQIEALGMSYDWNREISSHDPEFMKWTQWLFLRMYEKGIAYRDEAPVNWCPKDQTVLANEQVEADGTCERCGTEVIQKNLKQWFIKITDYSDRLIEDLDGIDWPHSTKLGQINWIGRSEGANVRFNIATEFFRKPIIENVYQNVQYDLHTAASEAQEKGMKALALGVIRKPNGSVLILKSADGQSQAGTWELPGGSIDVSNVKTELQREVMEETGLTDLEFNFMFSYDGYNPEFDRTYRYFCFTVDLKDDVEVKISDEHSEFEFASVETAIEKLNWEGHKRAVSLRQIEVFTTAFDTIYGATFLVVAPEHKIISNSESLISNFDLVQDYLETAKTKTELVRQQQKEKTGIKIEGLSAINPVNGKEVPIYVADYVLGGYGTGAIMAVPGHDERDSEFAEKYGLEIIPVVKGDIEGFISYTGDVKSAPEKFLVINSAEFDGMDFKQGREAIMQHLIDMGVADRKTQYRLRDWLISRQRYWGCPIPIVYDPEGNPHGVKEEHLPLLLPTDVDFKPTGKSPIHYSKSFIELAEELYGEGWRFETDTLDTFMDSTWYFFRFTDPHNKEEFAAKDSMNVWMPVDLYVGGAEHTVLHLMYARFFTKFLYDNGYVDFNEPFFKLRHPGMVLAEDGRKMSKRWGNTLDPNEEIAKFGADTLRIYEMFMGPFNGTMPWNTKTEIGVNRFLQKIWHLSLKVSAESSDSQEREINKLIKKVTSDIEEMSFNTAVAKMMEFVNFLQKEISVNQSVWERFLIILAPFGPYITEELWSKLGNEFSIHQKMWPTYDESLIVDDVVEMGVQINGKMRGTIQIATDASQEEALSEAKKVEKINAYIGENEPKKVIYVAGKILNIIVESAVS